MRKLVGSVSRAVRLATATIFIFTAFIPSPALAQELAGALAQWTRQHRPIDSATADAGSEETAAREPLFDNYPAYAGDGPPNDPTGDPYPRPTPPSREKKDIDFTLTAAPAVVAYGDNVTFTVTIQNNIAAAVDGLTFSDVLETGFEFRPSQSPGVDYSGSGKTISHIIPALDPGEIYTFTYVATVTGTKNPNKKNGELWVHTAELKLQGNGPKLKARAALWVERALKGNQYKIGLATKGGGWTNVGDLSVYFAPDALATDSLVLVYPTQATLDGPIHQFQVEVIQTAALSADTDSAPREQKVDIEGSFVNEFAEEPFLQVGFEGLADLSNLPGGTEPFVSTFDEEAQVWVKVPLVDVDYENNHVTVQTRHFSTWGSGIGSSLPQNGANVLLFDQPYTSLFTGASRYAVPLWTPAGRGGMGPGLALSYSSATVEKCRVWTATCSHRGWAWAGTWTASKSCARSPRMRTATATRTNLP